MRTTLFFLLCLGSLMACEPKSCNAQAPGMVDALTYALDVMELRDNPDIKLALALYRRDLKAIDRGIDVSAFSNGKFDRERFVASHAGTRRVEAQAELFDTVYLILSNQEKVKLHQLMAGHMHYLELLTRESLQACDTRKNCNSPMKKQPCQAEQPLKACNNK